MKNKKHLPGKSHLPLYGVEPFYGAVIIAVTAVAVVAGHSALFEKGMIKGMRIPSEMSIGIIIPLAEDTKRCYCIHRQWGSVFFCFVW